ncbi:laccase TilA [Penicillium soppii]|uniref:laccase TilA n=1 Tax=Penicillium soppii TaxID=69789 RepID=UPI002546F70A|nr:laccase TilA [Penicillium soppii]KAJ5874769.1 laccase TilA [Penicillium soppii]
MHSSESGQQTHAIHKHSNKFHVISSGIGAWNYTSVAEAMQFIPESFSLKKPSDPGWFIVAGTREEQSQLAIRYHVINPGAVIIHCQVQRQFSGGIAMPILDGVDAWPVTPLEYELKKIISESRTRRNSAQKVDTQYKCIVLALVNLMFRHAASHSNVVNYLESFELHIQECFPNHLVQLKNH